MNSVTGKILVLNTQLTDEALNYKLKSSLLSPLPPPHRGEINILCALRFSDRGRLQETEARERDTVEGGLMQHGSSWARPHFGHKIKKNKVVL